MAPPNMPPPRRGAKTLGFVYHASVQQPTFGPKGQGVGDLQKLGKWCSPSADETSECDDTGAPTVSATVSVKLAAGQTDANQTWEDAFLRVRFGSGEIDDQILDVDLINGTSFPLIARDAIFYLVYPVVPSVQGKTQPKIDVQISIGLGVLGASGARGARRTVKVGDLTGNVSSTAFPIPPFAVGAVYCSTDATTTAELTQGGSVGNATPVLSVSTIEKFEYRSAPVRHGARGFTLKTAQASTGNAVIFYLSPA